MEMTPIPQNWITVIVKRRPNQFKRNYLTFRFQNLKQAKDFILEYGYSGRVVKIFKEPQYDDIQSGHRTKG
jgi:hypothetical protein